MSTQKGTSVFKKWWFWVIVGVVLIGALSTATNGDKTDDVSGSAATTTDTATETPTELSTTEPAFDWAVADVNEENIRLALQDVSSLASSTITTVALEEGSDEKAYQITLTVDSGLPINEDFFLREMMQQTVRSSEALFENPAIESVTLHSIISYTDKYGKSLEDDSSFITFTRETAEKLDYDGFVDRAMGDYSVCFAVSDAYNITRGVYIKLTESGGMEQSK